MKSESEFDLHESESFVSVARQRRMLDELQAKTLLERSVERGVMPSTLAVDLGLLMPVEVEIVEAFLEPRDLAPGYELLDVLGYGALGVVYRARQPHLHRDVAIKAILKSRLSQQNVAARFQQEGAVIGRLQHPNIVSAYDFGSHRERLYLVMELVNGQDLSKRLDAGRVSIRTGLSIVRQTASGLAHALSHEIIHRDIKPGNLLLTEAPKGYDLPAGVPLVKIADFGLARFNREANINDQDTRLTLTGAALGTPMYCAPEQLSGDNIDHRADIYALGATFFSILTGEPPYASEKVSKIIAAKVTGQDPQLELLPASVPAEVRDLLLDMMKPEADLRIGDYDHLIERIDAVSLNLGVGADDETAELSSTTIGTIRDDALGSSASESGSAATDGGRRGWTRFVLPVLAVVVLAIVGFAAPRFLRQEPSPTLVPGDWNANLFDGTSLSGWTVKGGNWNTGIGEEDGRVLVGGGVSVVRLLPEPPVDQRNETLGLGFRVGVNLLEANGAEVQFGFPGDGDVGGERFVLAVDQNEIVLGRKKSSNATLERLGPAVALVPRRPDQSPYHDIRVERHGDNWFAYFDDQQVGHAPFDSGQSKRMIVLTTNGVVHFEGPLVYQLGAPEMPAG